MQSIDKSCQIFKNKKFLFVLIPLFFINKKNLSTYKNLIFLIFDSFIKKSYTASHFTASLELVKEGFINIRQHAPFAPIYIKKKSINKK